PLQKTLIRPSLLPTGPILQNSVSPKIPLESSTDLNWWRLIARASRRLPEFVHSHNYCYALHNCTWVIRQVPMSLSGLHLTNFAPCLNLLPVKWSIVPRLPALA